MLVDTIVNAIVRLFEASWKFVFALWTICGVLLLPVPWLGYLHLSIVASRYHDQALLGFVGSSAFLFASMIAPPAKSIWRGIEQTRQFSSKRKSVAKSIKVVGPKPIGVKLGVPSGLFYEDDSDSPEFTVAAVGFRIDPSTQRKAAPPSLAAQLIYRDHRERELANCPAGVWLGQYSNEATFSTREKWLVIFVWNSKRKMLTRLWNESYYHKDSWMGGGGPSFQIVQEGVPPNTALVEIRLLDDHVSYKSIRFDVEMPVNGLPELKEWSGRLFLRRD